MLQYLKKEKMGKLIIDNRSDVSDSKALEFVISVINMGRISNNNRQYCYDSIIKEEGKEYCIWTYLNKNSDRFIIVKYK